MNTEINATYEKMKAEFLAAMDVEVNEFNVREGVSLVTCGDVDLYVTHKITIDREPRTEWTYSGGEDHEVTTGVDYEATVNVEFVTVSLSIGVVLPVTLPEAILNRVIDVIAKAAEEKAEQDDDEAATDAYEASFD